MDKKTFKNHVYDLAKFNSELSKGYMVNHSQSDIEGYSRKNIELKKLIDIAIKNNYPVFYDARTNVVYFLFGEIQISFHTGSGLFNKENFGLAHTPIEWDGVKNAFKYSEKEYLELKKERLIEIENRKKNKKKKEIEFVFYLKKYEDFLFKKLKRVRSQKSKEIILTEIRYISNARISTLVDYFSQQPILSNKLGVMNVVENLKPMYKDSYITTYTVG